MGAPCPAPSGTGVECVAPAFNSARKAGGIGPEMLDSLPMSTFLLVHGAWHGGWCWRKIAPLLEAKGHTVFAPDLPSHGKDRTLASSVTLESYVDRICQIAVTHTEPVILLGHSMGGVCI